LYLSVIDCLVLAASMKFIWLTKKNCRSCHGSLLLSCK
jgi:Ni,Fe-hydrogenase I small subunit